MRLRFVAVDENLAPIELRLCQEVIEFKCFLLFAKYVDHDTNKHIEYEEMEYEDDDEEADDSQAKVLLLWHMLNFGLVNSGPHDVDPALRRHNIKQSDHRCTDVIEVRVRVDPLTAIVQTLKFSFDMFVNIIHELINDVARDI